MPASPTPGFAWSPAAAPGGVSGAGSSAGPSGGPGGGAPGRVNGAMTVRHTLVLLGLVRRAFAATVWRSYLPEVSPA